MNNPITDLNDLLARAEAGRRDRAHTRPMGIVEWDGTTWKGTCRGQAAPEYRPVIRVGERRSFNCTCVDVRQRGWSLGPCKHVISLAFYAIQALHLRAALEGSDPADPQ